MPKPIDVNQWNYMFSDDIKFVQKAVILHPTNNTILVLQRAMDSATHPGYWDFAGGNVLYGESSTDSILKEIEEETALHVNHEMKPIMVDAVMKHESNKYRIFVGYVTTALNEHVVLSNEHSEFKWVTIEEFQSLLTLPIYQEMIRKYVQICNNGFV